MKSAMKKLGPRVLGMVESLLGEYVALRLRPKTASGVHPAAGSPSGGNRVAVILQGPLLLESQFTLETVKTYRRLFPDAMAIVSTWQDENPQALKSIESAGATIVQSEVPQIRGTANINCQIVSTAAGVAEAEARGATHILKTRTDVRLYAENALSFLANVLAAFPVSPGYAQQGRIVGLSLNTFKYRPYSLSDLVVFGTTGDMKKFWNCPLDTRHPSPDGKAATIRGWTQMRLAEAYLSTHFLEAVGRRQKWSLEDSWDAFAEHFCVVDQGTVDIYWHKYKRYQECRHLQYGERRTDSELTFSGWLELYLSRQGLAKKVAAPEDLLDLAFGASVTALSDRQVAEREESKGSIQNATVRA